MAQTDGRLQSIQLTGALVIEGANPYAPAGRRRSETQASLTMVMGLFALLLIICCVDVVCSHDGRVQSRFIDIGSLSDVCDVRRTYQTVSSTQIIIIPTAQC